MTKRNGTTRRVDRKAKIQFQVEGGRLVGRVLVTSPRGVEWFAAGAVAPFVPDVANIRDLEDGEYQLNVSMDHKR